MFLDNPVDLIRLAIVAALTYPALIALLRFSGKRTLSKLNAFDLVVTVALGSTLATILLSRDVSLAEGLLALALLVGLQFLVALLTVRWPASQRLVKSAPTLLLHRGELRRDVVRAMRISESEIRQAARSQGYGDLSRLAAVVLETDGSLSVIGQDKLGDGSSLTDVSAADGSGPGSQAD
ncbi:DUF421 domain-containing protein [Micromonospora citrea]|uniref:DUF421 domain-containing protein n=1 Tax=Micromonospora citrea TaxID=47855 RepID=UPI003C4DB3EF